MKEGKKLSQNRELSSQGKLNFVDFLDKGNVDIMDFWERKSW